MSIQGLASLAAILTMFAIPGAIIYGIYYLIKRLIRYNAECQDRYTRRRKTEQDLNDLEAELNSMKDHDWAKEGERS